MFIKDPTKARKYYYYGRNNQDKAIGDEKILIRFLKTALKITLIFV